VLVDRADDVFIFSNTCCTTDMKLDASDVVALFFDFVDAWRYAHHLKTLDVYRCAMDTLVTQPQCEVITNLYSSAIENYHTWKL